MLSMKKIHWLFFYPVLLLAGPPMNSNDPFVPNLGNFEVNIAFSRESQDSLLTQFPIIDANYGLAKNIEVTVESAYTYMSDTKDIDAFGFAVKWLFYQGDFFAMAINPAYFSFPIDSVYHTGETYAVSMPMNFILSKSLTFVIDTIYINPKNDLEHLELGAYMSFARGKHNFMIELYSDDILSDQTVPLLLNGGYTYSINQTYAFLFSYGKEIKTQSTRATFFFAALQCVF